MEDFGIFLGLALNLSLPLLTAWLLDRWLGDPSWLPHPVVLFGKVIACCEHRLNKGRGRVLKGAVTAVTLVIGVYLLSDLLFRWAASFSLEVLLTLQILVIFYCLAGTTLIREVRMVFEAVDRSLEEGRKQVGRIVGRDTSSLSAQEVRTAALETLAENLSDGVIAPLFWYMVLGVPGMLAYKMVNTLDSMIGYRNERYREFGRFAARMDDVANYIPARLTALLMIVTYRFGKRVSLGKRRVIDREQEGTLPQHKQEALWGGSENEKRCPGFFSLLRFVGKYGKQHASPNSGYPEAALAGILNCRFGGPHNYFGEEVWKPYIGKNDRLLTTLDMQLAVRINHRAEVLMMIAVILMTTVVSLYL